MVRRELTDQEREDATGRSSAVSEGIGTVLHEGFADEVAQRLEARAGELEQEGHLVGHHNAAGVRARVFRLAADVTLQEAATVTQEEVPQPAAQAWSLRPVRRRFRRYEAADGNLFGASA